MKTATRPRFGDMKTTFYRVRITAGGYIKMVEVIPGCFSCHETLADWMERHGSGFAYTYADVCAYPKSASNDDAKVGMYREVSK